MNDIWTDRLSEYLDGDLTEDERRELERHLDACAACRATVAELSDVADEARRLDDIGPRRDLWPAIARSAPRPASRVSVSFVELIAASVLIALLSGATVWIVMSRGGSGPVSTVQAEPPVEASASVAAAGETYDRAVADLLQALDEGRKSLSPRTIEVIERSLGTVDRAIAEASAALDQDPGNVFLSLHLARERQRKLALLRQVRNIAERSDDRRGAEPIQE